MPGVKAVPPGSVIQDSTAGPPVVCQLSQQRPCGSSVPAALPIADLSKAKITHPGKKVRITLDVPEALVRDIDEVRARIGVDRGALIKVWLHERVAKEKVG